MPLLEVLKRDQGPVIEHHGQDRLAVTWRHAPLPLALVVVEGDLRRRLPPAGHGLIEEPNRRAVLVGGQHLQAPQRVPAPGPVADGLEAAGRLVIGVAPAPRLAGLQWRRRLVVDILAALNARPNGIRQHLREALHLSRGVWRVNEPGTADDGLESGHDLPFVGQGSGNSLGWA